MIDKKFLAGLKKSYQDSESQRRQIISASNNLLFLSKKAIFALQRQELTAGAKRLTELETALADMEKRFGATRLNQEGAFRAAIEEYFEAKSFHLAIQGKIIAPAKGLDLGHEAYLGGLCDMVGELVRYATNQAAAGKFAVVSKMKEKADGLMIELADFDMSGYLRTKYDQARGHLRKLEQMAYEIRLRNKK